MKLKSDEVNGLPFPGGNEEKVNASAGHGDFWNYVQFVPRLVERQKVQRIREHLPARKQAHRADEDRLRVGTIADGACSNGDFRPALSHLDASPAKKRTSLVLDCLPKSRSLRRNRRQPKQLGNAVAQTRRWHLSFANLI